MVLTKEFFAERERAKQDNIAVLRDKSFDLLMTIVSSKRPQKILEIGTAYGLSGIGMLLSSPSSRLTAIEIDENCISVSRENYKKFGVEKRVNFYPGDACEIIPVLGEKFDLIFLDGPKGQYFSFLPYLISLLEVGGMIFADDVSFHGYVSGENEPNKKRKHDTIIRSLTAYVDSVTNDERLQSVVLDIEDGVAITVKIKD
ncbi:MAG: O-methyltransferase [Clostridia bacterium]|nr:O-methyltransferase [Clostridia bacterium]